MRSLTRNIFSSIIIASLLTMLITIGLIMGIYYYNFNSLLIDELAEETQYIAHGISQSGLSFFDGLESENVIILVDNSGTVLYSNTSDSDNVCITDYPEISDAFEHGSGSDLRNTALWQPKILCYASRLSDNTVLRLSAQQPAFRTMLSLVFGSLLLLALAVVILSAIFANRMSARIIRPINDLNITSPDESTCYRELVPLIKRIRTQNSFISRQMDELRSKHEEFTAITGNMSEGFLLIDEKREIISFNSSARRILDLGHESNVIDRNNTLVQAIDTALSGKRDECEVSFGGADYRIITSPVMNENEVSGAAAIILDITEKSRREAMRREFTSNVSHELKTPLTSIKAAAEMLSGGIVAQQDVNRFYGMIQNESSRLISLVNDILRLSQLDENAIADENTLVELRTIAESVAHILSNSAEANDITITINGSGVVSGVPTILEEMIFNLCDNAVKYNKPGGRVTVDISSSDDKVMLSVTDTGIGIPAEMYERIFERFYRVDKSRSKEIGGTGLGLSIVRHAANYHNADISVDSRVGEGTKITVTFNQCQ